MKYGTMITRNERVCGHALTQRGIRFAGIGRQDRPVLRQGNREMQMTGSRLP